MFEMIDLQELIRKAESVEPLPQSAQRLASLLADPESDTEDVVRTVSTDPALAARVLRAANSAANAARVGARTPREAVLRLGRGAVLTMAVAGGVVREMRGAVPQYGLAREALWRHSVAAANAVEAMLPHVRVQIPPEAATAALLHDVGKIVMAQFLAPTTLEYLERAQREGGLSERQAEAELLGAHHAELGALMARSWNLNETIAKGIQYHHDPEIGGEIVCDVVCLADALAWTLPGEERRSTRHLESAEPSCARLGISAAALDAIRASCADRMNDLLARLAG
jgi:putative nucleotidyltransferase with HDIG domain